MGHLGPDIWDLIFLLGDLPAIRPKKKSDCQFFCRSYFAGWFLTTCDFLRLFSKSNHFSSPFNNSALVLDLKKWSPTTSISKKSPSCHCDDSLRRPAAPKAWNEIMHELALSEVGFFEKRLGGWFCSAHISRWVGKEMLPRFLVLEKQ